MMAQKALVSLVLFKVTFEVTKESSCSLSLQVGLQEDQSRVCVCDLQIVLVPLSGFSGSKEVSLDLGSHVSCCA